MTGSKVVWQLDFTFGSSTPVFGFLQNKLKDYEGARAKGLGLYLDSSKNQLKGFMQERAAKRELGAVTEVTCVFITWWAHEWTLRNIGASLEM